MERRNRGVSPFNIIDDSIYGAIDLIGDAFRFGIILAAAGTIYTLWSYVYDQPPKE